MSYSGTVRRLLISCPGDVSPEDLSLIHKAIGHWNGVYGPHFATAIVPISWGAHAAAEFGQPPQDVINDQLVDTCDGCLAIFASRLGTPTSNAESGTAEEIQRLAEAGRYVAVLRSTAEVDPTRIDAEQLRALNEYLAKIGSNGLVLSYSSDSQLAERVQTLLANFVSRDGAKSEAAIAASTTDAEIWPRVESRESVETDGRGRLKTRRHRYLVLHNTGSKPARSVTFSLSAAGGDGQAWMVLDGRNGEMPTIPILAPNGEVRFSLLLAYGIASQVQCTVSWEQDGQQRSNEATLRI